MKKYLIPNRMAATLLMIVPALVLSACQNATTTPEPAAPATIQEVDVVFGPGAFNFTDTTAGLADLSSYKATLVISFDGTRDGQVRQWTRTYIMLSSQEPAARELTIEKSGDSADPDPVFMAEADGAAYELGGEGLCTASAIVEGNSLSDRLEPASFLGGVVGAEVAGSESVNGIEANHYIFNERALGQVEGVKSEGEVWVATEGGFIVKYMAETQGAAEYFGEGIEGKISWDYELTDINQPIIIELPADCPPGIVNAPLLPDASNIMNIPGVLTYTTSTGLAEASAFYQEQLPGLGWTAVGEPGSTETTVLMEYGQGNQSLSVIITAEDEGAKVRLMLKRTPE